MATPRIYGVLLRYAIARPTSPSSVTGLSADDSISVGATSDAPAFDTNYRSTVEIVWSCLTVIIASSWLCVHPNVTGHSTTMWQRLRERLLLFAIAVFAPEIMAVFAFYQWRGSRKLYKDFKEREERLKIRLQLDSSAPTPATPKTPSSTTSQASDIPDSDDQSNATQSPTSPTSTAPESSMQHSVSEDGDGWNVIQQFWSSVQAIRHAILRFGTDPKESMWSYTHAHFVQMGGIAFRETKEIEGTKETKDNVGFKWPKNWTDQDLETFFSLKLTEGAISDKSKAGALAKTLVVARVLWFLIQAIARKAQGLPLALLEVASLAFIAFNFAMYVFWWNKPLDVEYPIQITGIPGPDRPLSIDDVWEVPLGILRGAFDTIPIGSWMYSPTRRWYPRFYAFGKELDMMNADGRLTYNFDFIFRLTIALTSAAFGAFHTIGWHLPAPSQAELDLWRVACLGLTLYPLLLFILSIAFAKLTTFISEKFNFKFDDESIRAFCSIVIGLPCGIAYVAARLAILLLPFFELRDLPPLVHRTVSWSRLLSPI